MAENWKPLQGVFENIKLDKEKLPNLINVFEEEFGEDEINIINISFTVNDNSEKDKNAVGDIVSLSHRSSRDRDKNRLLVDMKRTKTFTKVKNAIKVYLEDK